MRSPPKANGPCQGAAAEDWDVNANVNSELLAPPAPDATLNFSGCGSNHLIAQLDAARDRIDRATDLLSQSFHLRAQLTFGLDLDQMTAEVNHFKRSCLAWRPYEEAAS
jgi:hypothetical protein